jgi:hypothetical protein
MSDQPVDWRGTPINVGDTVIYGGPVGRSIQQVEGLVEGFTKSGRVNVKITRRSYSTPGGDGDKRIVHVGTDRLTIVRVLPPTKLPTWDESIAEAEQWRRRRLQNRATHDIQEGQFSSSKTLLTYGCTRCHRSSFQCGQEVCDVEADVE